MVQIHPCTRRIVFNRTVYPAFSVKLEDCALQLYKYNSSGQADYGVYLDLDITLDDQWEELEGFSEQ